MIGIDRNYRTFRRDARLAARIPLANHVTPGLVLTPNSDLIAGFRLFGTAPESLSDAEINHHLGVLQNLVKNLLGSRYSLYAHTIRRRIDPSLSHASGNPFADAFCRDYYHTLWRDHFYENRLYLVLLQKRFLPHSSILSLLPSKHEQNLLRASVTEDVQTFEELLGRIQSVLSSYRPERLTTTKDSHGTQFSTIGSLYAELIGYRPRPIPITATALSELIAQFRLLWSGETGEVRLPDTSRYFALFSIKGYTTPTDPFLFESLIGTSVEYTFTHSFSPIPTEQVVSALTKRRRVIRNTDADASSLADDLGDALDAIRRGDITYGEHHATLTVFSPDLKALVDDASVAYADFAKRSLSIVREDAALGWQYVAQLNGNHRYRVRPALISSHNFCDFVPQFAPLAGNKDGNYWGEAVITFRSQYGTPVYFSLHVQDTGSTLLTGMTGSGKTALMGSMLTASQKYPATHLLFDRNRGNQLTIEALGGLYTTLRDGEPTGFNPFRMAPTASHRQYLLNLLRTLIARPLDAIEDTELSTAIDHVYQDLPVKLRSLSSLVTYLTPGGADCIQTTLSKWCQGGSYAWVFDNPEDTIDFERLKVYGFDLTDFLSEHADSALITAISSYLLYRVNTLLGKYSFIVWIDEFWRMIQEERFGNYIVELINTVRKNDGLIVAATQSPNQVLRHPRGREFMQGIPTKIFLPNPEADREEYLTHMRLTETEWELFAPLQKNSRQFLLKQQQGEGVGQVSSTLCTFDLGRLKEYIRIFAANKDSLAQFDARKARGEPPLDLTPLIGATRA